MPLLSIGAWNLKGLKNAEINKVEEEDFIQFVDTNDIIIITETHLGKQESLALQDFKIIHTARDKHTNAPKNSGGVLIAYRRKFQKGITVCYKANTEFIWLKLGKDFFKLDKDIYLAGVYIGPSNSPYLLRTKLNTFKELEKSIKKYNKLGEILIMGDLNSRTQDRAEIIPISKGKEVDAALQLPESVEDNFQYRANADLEINDNGRKLLKLCQKFELRIVNGRKWKDLMGQFTCFQYGGNSLVDYAVASESCFDWITDFKVGEFIGDISDHAPIMVTLKTSHDAVNLKDIETIQVKGLEFLWNDNSHLLYKQELCSLNNEIDIILMIENYKSSDKSEKSVNTLVKKFSNVLINAAKNSVPYRIKRAKKRGRKRKNKKWFDHECTDLRNTVKKLGRAVQAGKVQAKADFYKFKKQYKKLLKKKVWIFKKDLIDQMCQEDENKSNEYWTKLKKLRQTEQDISGIFIPFREWVNHYNDVFRKITNNTKNVEKTTVNEKIFNMTDKKITEKEVKEALGRLKKNKASYFDLISTDMLISTPPQVVKNMAEIFNLIFISGLYPTEWGKAYISPIYKKGSKEIVSNYRPIAISSCIGKVFNAIMNARLVLFLNEKGLTDDYQNGFKKNARTSDNLFILTSIIDDCKAKKKQLFACYIDLKGAYDTVDRELLCSMLRDAGVGNMFQNIIENMYSKVEYCIKIGNIRSHFFKAGRGLKQGDTMSPALFNFYIHKLVEILKNNTTSPFLKGEEIPCLLFADDIILISESEKDLKEKIKVLQTFIDNLGMKISQEKSKIVVYNKPRKWTKETWTVGNLSLEEVDSYNYLGLDVTSKGKAILKNDSLTGKGRRAMYALFSLAKEIPVKLALKLFKQLIQPILLYGAEMWVAYTQINRLRRLSVTEAFWSSSAQQLEIDKLQNLYLKKVIGVKKYASTNGVRGDTGEFPLYIDATKAAVKFWERLQETDNKLLIAARDTQEELANKGAHSWGLGVRRIREKTRENEQIGEVHNLIQSKEIKQILSRNFESLWFSNLWKEQSRTEGKFLFYRTFKKDFTYEKYLNMPRSNARKELSRFRISAHHLMVEKGRQSGTPRDQRLCQICKNGVEDEWHFFKCPGYAGLRLQGGIRGSQVIKYMEEGSTEAAYYIHQATKLRTELLKKG